MFNIKGTTFYTVGNVESPEHTSEINNNVALPSVEALVFASFAKGDKTSFYKFLAVGGGSKEHFIDPQNPPVSSDLLSELGDTPKLFSEFYRKPVTFTRFIDPNTQDDNKFTATNYGIIELIWTFSKDEAVGTWRELGIFAGDSTEEANSGKLVHYQTIQDFEKTPSFVIGRDFNWHWRLDFNEPQ
jgi:hypothetical protein